MKFMSNIAYLLKEFALSYTDVIKIDKIYSLCI